MWVSAQSAVPCTAPWFRAFLEKPLVPCRESHGSGLAPPPVCDGCARWSWGRAVFIAPRRCGLEGHGAGACRKPSISGFEMGHLEPQGRACGPWAALGCFPLCPGTNIHTCGWRELPLWAWELLWSSNGGQSLLCSNLSRRLSLPALRLPNPSRVTAAPHLQNWRE